MAANKFRARSRPEDDLRDAQPPTRSTRDLDRGSHFLQNEPKFIVCLDAVPHDTIGNRGGSGTSHFG